MSIYSSLANFYGNFYYKILSVYTLRRKKHLKIYIFVGYKVYVQE